MKVKDQFEAKALLTFRKTTEALYLKRVLERELAQAREAYEASYADEDTRASIDAHKVLVDRLFTSPVEIEQ